MKWTTVTCLVILKCAVVAGFSPVEGMVESQPLPSLRGADPIDVRVLVSSSSCSSSCVPPSGTVCMKPSVSRTISASDGSYSDWANLMSGLDFLPMYNQGNPTTEEGEPSLVLAKAYMNYNCGANEKVCLLVLAEPSVTLQPNNGNAWVKIYEYSSSPISPDNSQFLTNGQGQVIGWEACVTPILKSPFLPLRYGAPGAEIHVNDAAGNAISTGNGGKNSGPLFYLELPLCGVDCATTLPTQPPTTPSLTTEEPTPTTEEPTRTQHPTILVTEDEFVPCTKLFTTMLQVLLGWLGFFFCDM